MGATIAKNKNTSNLWSHLRIQHPDKQRKWTNSENRSKLMDKLVIEMVTNNQPFSVVSDGGFKHLMAAAEPQYALKSERYQTEKLQDVHHKVVHKIKAMIQSENAGYSLSFTTDCWAGVTESHESDMPFYCQ